MDRSTHDVRRANWFNIITKCQQRPANISVSQWLADNSIKEKAYYYWLRKFRGEACKQTQLPATPPAEVSFAELSIPAAAPVKPVTANNTVAVISVNGITLEISNNISESLLCIQAFRSRTSFLSKNHTVRQCSQTSLINFFIIVGPTHINTWLSNTILSTRTIAFSPLLD